LEKHDDRRGRDAEQLVQEVAEKAPFNGYPNVHHGHLCLGELLLGPSIEMRGDPAIAGGQHVQTEHQIGMKFAQAPEVEAFQRWQCGEFHEVERRFARQWRQALTRIDLNAVYGKYRPARGARLSDLPAAKAAAERLLRADGHRYAMLTQTLDSVLVPSWARPKIIKRWKSLCVLRCRICPHRARDDG
jgi:hypothetical protein